MLSEEYSPASTESGNLQLEKNMLLQTKSDKIEITEINQGDSFCRREGNCILSDLLLYYKMQIQVLLLGRVRDVFELLTVASSTEP